VELLSSTTPVASAMMTVSKKNTNEDGDGDDDEENDGNSNAIDTSELNSSKKRKRKLQTLICINKYGQKKLMNKVVDRIVDIPIKEETTG
jgi:hypothetical protein